MFARPHYPFDRRLPDIRDPSIDPELIAMLGRDNDRMRKAGLKLAEAAMHVIREHDGCHRLALAVADWTTAIASEGDRDIRHGSAAPRSPAGSGL